MFNPMSMSLSRRSSVKFWLDTKVEGGKKNHEEVGHVMTRGM